MVKKTIRIPSVHTYLEQIVDETEAFVSNHFTDEDFIYKVVLSTTEAVTNAMKHGNGYDSSKSVTIHLSASQDRIDVAVEDEGNGFSRERVENPLKEDNLLNSFGRGIYLMENMADEMRYELGGRRILMGFVYNDSEQKF